MSAAYEKYRKTYTNKVTQLAVNATGGDQTVVSVKSANHDLRPQKIRVYPTTYAAVTWTFKETDSTGAAIGHISIPTGAVQTAGPAYFELDFGPEGFEMTAGKNLWLDVSATGAAAQITVEAYEKPAAGPFALSAGI